MKTGILYKCCLSVIIVCFISWTALHFASQVTDSSVTEFLAFKGADLHKQDSTGFAFLLYCFSYQSFLPCRRTCFLLPGLGDHDVDKAEILILCGTQIEAVDEYRYTCLMHAVQRHQWPLVKLLLDLNADTTKISKDGWDVSQTKSGEITQFLNNHAEKSVRLLIFLIIRI